MLCFTALIAFLDIMATFLKEELRQNGVSEEVIATLEEQEVRYYRYALVHIIPLIYN
jgi:hypothetical protein